MAAQYVDTVVFCDIPPYVSQFVESASENLDFEMNSLSARPI